MEKKLNFYQLNHPTSKIRSLVVCLDVVGTKSASHTNTCEYIEQKLDELEIELVNKATLEKGNYLRRSSDAYYFWFELEDADYAINFTRNAVNDHAKHFWNSSSLAGGIAFGDVVINREIIESTCQYTAFALALAASGGTFLLENARDESLAFYLLKKVATNVGSVVVRKPRNIEYPIYAYHCYPLDEYASKERERFVGKEAYGILSL